jgi:hypothetical protein
LPLPEGSPFWEPRYYDFNLWSEAKRVENLRYVHRNPVKRGLAVRPEDWKWSSFAHYATGVDGAVEIESQWTARRREQMGIVPRVRPTQNSKQGVPHPGGPRNPRFWRSGVARLPRSLREDGDFDPVSAQSQSPRPGSPKHCETALA